MEENQTAMLDEIKPENVESETDKKRDDFEDEIYEKAQRLFASLRPGFKLVIHRIAPRWCYGWCETIESSLISQSVDFTYIAEMWGGQKFKLQLLGPDGRYTSGGEIHIGHPPRYWGTLITPESWAARNQSIRAENAPVKENTETNVVELLKAMGQMRSDDFGLLKKLMDDNSKPVEQQKNPIEDLVNVARNLKELHGIFGDTAAAPVAIAPDNDMSMITQITSLISALKGNNTQNLPSPKPRIVQPEPPQPQAKPKQPISQVLANMEPEKLTTIMLTALGSMPENKRTKVLQDFLSRSGLMQANDGDDGDDDEGEDIEDQGSGRSLSADDYDDQADRAGD